MSLTIFYPHSVFFFFLLMITKFYSDSSLYGTVYPNMFTVSFCFALMFTLPEIHTLTYRQLLGFQLDKADGKFYS